MRQSLRTETNLDTTPSLPRPAVKGRLTTRENVQGINVTALDGIPRSRKTDTGVTYPDDVHFNSYHLLHAGRHQDLLGIGRVQRGAECRAASITRTRSL